MCLLEEQLAQLSSDDIFLAWTKENHLTPPSGSDILSFWKILNHIKGQKSILYIIENACNFPMFPSS